MEQKATGNRVIREMLSELEAQARGMWRFRWRAVVVAWLVSIFGWVAVYLMPDEYEARARIFVDTESAILPMIRGLAAPSDVMNQVTVVTREMLSRPNLAEVARQTDLDLRAENEKEFEDLLVLLRDRINVNGSRENIYSISFADPDRDKAVAVVNSLVDTFVEKSLGADRTESNQAQSFLETQIMEYESRLTTAEDRLATFKRENVAYMPGQRGDYFARLQQAQADFENSQGLLRLAEERRTELQRQLDGEEPVFGIVPTTPQGGSQGGFASSKIRELEAELEELRLRYTDKHPQIGQILATIEQLREQQAAEMQAAMDAGITNTYDGSSLETNPVYQNMRIQLTNTDVEIASLRAQARQQRDKVGELRLLVDTIPQVEAELNRLNRDYDVVKSKYEELLQQYEIAKIGEDVKQTVDNVQFRIIDPPFSALEPAGPKRQLFLAMVFIAALALGAAVTFAHNLLNPVFFSTRSVGSIVGVPILGSVSLLLTSAARREKIKGRVQFALAISTLLVASTVVALFANSIAPTVQKLVS